MTGDRQAVVRVRAHAKINLNLRILRRREDGYHDLRTVFQAIDLHDTLTFIRRSGAVAIECDDPRLAVDSSNLVWRAGDLLWRHLGGESDMHGVAVRIEKRIPMKAGLGGGSSDAAAALRGFARLWRPQMAAAELAPLGRQLGADVGFFFTGGAALGAGRGDEICPLPDVVPLGVLLVVPPFEISTADAYRWWDEAHAGQGRGASIERRQAGARPTARAVPGCTWPSPDSDLVNDFEPVVCDRHPEIAGIVQALHAQGAGAAAMTGSGSTVFGLFDSDETLARAADTLAAMGHSVLRTRTLTRDEYDASSEGSLSVR